MVFSEIRCVIFYRCLFLFWEIRFDLYSMYSEMFPHICSMGTVYTYVVIGLFVFVPSVPSVSGKFRKYMCILLSCICFLYFTQRVCV